MSKHQSRVLRGLRRKGMSTAEIIERYRILRPASVIEYLREKGHLIMTKRIGRKGMARYYLLKL